MALPIISMPYIMTAKPRKMPPSIFFFSFLQNIFMPAPMMARMGEKEVGLSS